MKRKAFFLILVLGLFINYSFGCTNLIVTKGASKDGSVIITYTCDGEFHPSFNYIPAATYAPGDSLEIKTWGGRLLGKIHQVERTYSVVRCINEHQVAIAETTFDGRLELQNKKGLLHYWKLMQLALQRSKTAREAIKVMTDLVAQYGYSSTGESFSIADKNEAWILEMIGKGPDKKGAVWVAVKIPDGHISAHANKARIGSFPLNDPENCLYSEDVIDLAVEKGYYDPDSGEEFSFCEAYCPATPRNKRYAESRVWSLFRRAAPSMNLSSDYHRAVEGAERYPLSIKPDEKIDVNMVFSLMRDHYEGTDFDMTKGIDAGPYNSPVRYRPMAWKVDDKEYYWERPISTQQTGFSFVSQSRSWLPDEVGGVLWYGVDDTYFSCYVPMYSSIVEIPKSFRTGSIGKFSWDSAWWVFNFVANFANLRYSDMKTDIQAVQKDIEGNFLALQPAIEKTAVELFKTDKELAVRFLTDYCVTHGELTVKKWKELGEYLIRKYNDGYVQDENHRPHEKGYSEEWLRKVLKLKPKNFLLPKNKSNVPESRLID
ncbi:MAG: dipeptidase [Rhodothermaceae bacterium]